MKLLAYKISGQTVGIDLEEWSNEDLSGNTPFNIIQDEETIPSGYTDISSIKSWGYWGEEINPKIQFMEIRGEIKKLLTPSQVTGNTSGLTSEEIEVIEEYKLDEYYTMYEYFENLPEDINPRETPYDLNYDILGLHKKRIFDQGELNTVEYYGKYDFINNIYSDLLVRETRIYYRINEMVHRREMEISWYLNTGVSGATKNTTKYYTQQESIIAGERRRRHVISTVKVGALGLIMQTSGLTMTDAQQLGFAFLTEYADAIDVYIEGALQFLYGAILNDTNHEWLDNVIPNTGGLTIRNWMYNEVELDYTVNNTYV